MSYPQGAPGGPGYPPAQPQNAYFSAPNQQSGNPPKFDAAGASKLPVYLAAAVAALGLLVYLASFGPQFSAATDFFINPFRIDLTVVASVLAGLISGVGLLPKQTARPAPAGVLSLLSFMLVVSVVLTAPSVVTIDWGLYLVVAFTALQTIVGVGALLLNAGVITAPVPRPRYEQPQQYGQYPGAYYGPPAGQPVQGPPPHQQAPSQQRPGYPPQYGGSGYPGTDPSTGGFPVVSPSEQAGQAGESGPPTPPTGFPTHGRPLSSNAPTTQAPTQRQDASSSQSDQSSS